MKLDRLNYPGQIEQTVSITTTLLENQILSIYLYGSAVLGGLHPDSDIDILVLTNSEMTDRIRAELTRQVMDASGAVGNPEKRPIEITVVNQNDILPWRFPPKCEYMYGEWCGTKWKPEHSLNVYKSGFIMYHICFSRLVYL